MCDLTISLFIVFTGGIFICWPTAADSSLSYLYHMIASPHQGRFQNIIVLPQVLSTTTFVLITSCIDQNLSTIPSPVARYLRYTDAL